MVEEKRTKYIIHKANIMDDDGNKRMHGEVVSLTAKTAKHYNRLGYLRPFLEDEDDEDGGGAVVKQPAPKPAEPVRDAAVSKVTSTPAGASTK